MSIDLPITIVKYSLHCMLVLGQGSISDLYNLALLGINDEMQVGLEVEFN